MSMNIVVTFAVPDDDDMHAIIRGLEIHDDHPGLLEMAYCCDAYTARVEYV